MIRKLAVVSPKILATEDRNRSKEGEAGTHGHVCAKNDDGAGAKVYRFKLVSPRWSQSVV